MFKKLLFLVILVNTGMVLFGQVGVRHFEPSAGYSICPPRSWEIMSFPGQPLKMFAENTMNGFPGMMTFVSSFQPGTTLENRWRDGLANLSRAIPEYKAISTSDFTTNKGLKGKKHIYTQRAGSWDQRVIAYMFLAPNGRSVTINCGVVLSHGDRYDKVFDESVATLEFDN